MNALYFPSRDELITDGAEKGEIFKAIFKINAISSQYIESLLKGCMTT
jgi:hypothetical protein